MAEAGKEELKRNPDAREELAEMYGDIVMEFTKDELITRNAADSYEYTEEFIIHSIEGNEILMEGLEDGSPNGYTLLLTVLDENHIKIKQKYEEQVLYFVKL